MASASSDRARSAPLVEFAPRFRLRHLLLLGVLATCVHWVVPKGQAAWRLHNQAVIYADYALCMVGPTGPDLLLEDQAAFRELARRRIVGAMPEEIVFSSCQSFAEQMRVEHGAFRLHGARAVDFHEYKNGPGSHPQVSLAELDLSLSRLTELAEQAWPFVRSGPAPLMKPSSHAKEGHHALAAPSFSRGTGLPPTREIYRSTATFGDTIVLSLGSGANATTLVSKNGGIDFVPGGSRLADDLRDRCVADDEGRSFTLSRLGDGRHIALSHGPGAPPQLAVLSNGDPIASIACDASALVAVLVSESDPMGRRPVHLRICPFSRPCSDMSSPESGDSVLYYPVDVARVGGDTVVARTADGITRVTSSRDDGRSWTPWTVAYDREVSGAAEPAPFRLLTVGDSVLLFSGAAPGRSYPLLVSTDHGASFHAPVGTPQAQSPSSVVTLSSVQ